MKNEMNKELSDYYSQIKKLFIGSNRELNHLLGELKISVDEYVENNPNAGMEDVFTSFGTPEEIAGSFINNISVDKLMKKTQKKKILLMVSVLILIIYIVFIIVSFIDVHEEAHGYFVENLAAVYYCTGGLFLS